MALGLDLRDPASVNAGIQDWNPDETEDSFWPYTLNDSTLVRWNRSYPFQLIIVKKDENSETGYSRESSGRGVFTLPIPPQAMSISMPFAMSVSATLGGVVEENNGAPFRMIQFSGTTGVLPARGTGDMLKDPSSLSSIFAGTISAATATVGAVQTLLSSGPQNDSVYGDSDFRDPSFGQLTGYYQFRLLQRFLESYAALKKRPVGQKMRLAVAMWKDQAVYLVTPVQFDVQRSAQSPWEYTYSLSFKAWRRINLDDNVGAFDRAGPSLRKTSNFTTILQKLQEARQVLQNAQDVLRAVRGDVDASLFNSVREVVYFVKDAMGIAIAAADLPKNVIKDLKATCAEATSLKNIDQKLKEYYAQTGKAIEEDLADIKDLGSESVKTQTAAGSLQTAGQTLEGASPAVAMFDNPDDHYDFFSFLRPGDLNVPRAVQRKIDAETTRVRAFTRLDFEHKRDEIQAFAADFSDAVGAGDDTYNEVMGVTGRSSTRTPTPDEWDCIFALNQVVLEMNRLAATGKVNRESVTSLDYVAGLAQGAGIAFRMPVSKFAVPVPYGSTLEMMALTYLDDPQRWMEIAALNGLQAPYIDEEGFDLSLVVNGSGNQVAVADASNLYVGQQVWISSTTTTRTKRRITKIEKVTNNYTITVDGDSDLDRFSTMAQASLHAYLPNTCNSQQLIYIPSDKEVEDPDDRLRAIPGIDEFDPLIQVAGIDLLLTSSGDLAMTPDGDTQLAWGLTNIVQKVRTALGTPRGSLLYFPSYGLAGSLGMSVADLDPGELKNSIQNLLKSDPTFEGVTGVSFELRGPSLKISFGVLVRGYDQVIPITFAVRR